MKSTCQPGSVTFVAGWLAATVLLFQIGYVIEWSIYLNRCRTPSRRSPCLLSANEVIDKVKISARWSSKRHPELPY